jgi:hypothetical protein
MPAVNASSVTRPHSKPLVRVRAVTLLDPDTGKHWTVSEVLAVDLPGAPASACLVFDTNGLARRIWRYPANWADLSPRDLLRVSWQT